MRLKMASNRGMMGFVTIHIIRGYILSFQPFGTSLKNAFVLKDSNLTSVAQPGS